MNVTQLMCLDVTADNDAYNVIERKNAIVTGKNDAYGATATLSGLIDENMYEII